MIRNAIIGHIVGDMVGLPFEMCPRCYFKDKPFTDINRKKFKKTGHYSDDTAMVLATMQSIINCGGINYDDIMYEFYLWLLDGKYTQDDKPYGVGNTTFSAVQRYSYGVKALDCGINSEQSNGNGALMRMLPIILYLHKTQASDKQVKIVTSNITKLTHSHEINLLGTYIFTRFVLNILDGCSKDESYEMIRKIDYTGYSKKAIKKFDKILNVDIRTLKEKDIKSGGSIWETLEAVLWCILTSNGYKETIIKAINLGGDTDTIGAISGGVAGILYNDIPKEWIHNIIGFNKVDKIIKQFEKQLK